MKRFLIFGILFCLLLCGCATGKELDLAQSFHSGDWPKEEAVKIPLTKTNEAIAFSFHPDLGKLWVLATSPDDGGGFQNLYNHLKIDGLQTTE